MNDSLLPTSRRTSSHKMLYTSCADFISDTSLLLQSAQKFSVDSIKTAVGHHHDVIARSGVTRNILHNLRRGIESPCRSTAPANSFHQTIGRKLVFGQQPGRAKHTRYDNLIG